MIEHFAYGAATPALSFILSCLGCAAGLSCTARARLCAGRARSAWLVLGAVAIGGTGIFVMHFVAMLGFSIDGHEIRYGIPLTVLSAVLAVAVVGTGLFIVDRSGGQVRRLLIGGAVTGLGVAGMHYLGMAALHTDVTIHYDVAVVALSLLIAVVAASAGLWLAFNVRTLAAGTGAAVLMGVAVSGMHYTGMLAMSTGDAIHHAGGEVGGQTAQQLLIPLIVTLVVSTLALVVVVVLAPTPGEMRSDQEFAAWRDQLRETEDNNIASTSTAARYAAFGRPDDQRNRRPTGR